MRYQHLHSEVRQNVNQRILQQWRSILFNHNCQTRQATSLTSRSNKVTDLMHELDAIEQEELLKQLKSTGKKRIPVHVSTKIDAFNLPSLLSIQSHLQKGESELAWKTFDQVASQMASQSIPHSTTNKLLVTLLDLVNTNAPRLLHHNRKLQHVYYSRLESLAGVIRRNKDAYWDKEELGIALYLYGKLNQVKRAESLFKNMSHYTNATPPTVKDYNHLITVYLRQFNHVDTATKKRYMSKIHSLSQEMTKKGLEPTTSTYNLILAAQVKLQDFQGAEKLFAQMPVNPDLNTFHVFLTGYLKTCRNKHDREMVQLWMERLSQSGITPKRSTFARIIDGFAEQAVFASKTQNQSELKSIVASVTHLYKTMRRANHRPDVNIINALLKCYTAANDTEGVEKVMARILLPQKKGGCGNCGNCGCGGGGGSVEKKAPGVPEKIKVKPDQATFNMLIKYHLANDRSDQAFQMYDTMVNAKLEPDTITYNNFIWYYANQGNVKELLRYVDVMQKKGIPYNNFIYNTLLNCSLKYPEDAQLLEPHLHIMLASGASMPDTVSRNTLLARYEIEDQEDMDASFARYTDILERNLYDDTSLDTRSYNTILQSAGKFFKPASKDPAFHEISNQLNEIISSLDTSQMKPDVFTYALGIRNASYVGHMDTAESIYQAMVDAGVKPNNYVFSHLIHGYTMIGKVEKAQDILNHMVSQWGISPSAINYAPIIKGFAESAEYERAYRLFRDMLDHHVTPDLVIYTILASVFLKSPVPGNEKRAIELLEGIENAGIGLDAAALTTLVEAYSQEVRALLCRESVGQKKSESIAACTQKITGVYSRLKENQWLDARAMTAILSAYSSFNDPEMTWKVWNELKQSEASVHMSTVHYNAAMAGLVENKAWFPVVKMMYEEMHSNPSISPDAQTLQTVIWGAFNVPDYQMIRDVCRQNQVASMNVRAYYAALIALLNSNEVNEAKKVFEEFQKLPATPSSTTVWVGLINRLATLYGLEK